jgi:hypothetical protein
VLEENGGDVAFSGENFAYAPLGLGGMGDEFHLKTDNSWLKIENRKAKTESFPQFLNLQS